MYRGHPRRNAPTAGGQLQALLHTVFPRACTRVLAVLAAAYTRSTLQRKARVARLTTRVTSINEMILEVDGMNVAPSTKLTYINEASRALGMANTDELRAYRTVLQKQSALRPLKQAPPLTREVLEAVLPELTLRDQTALMLAWKTASRWGDIQKLQETNFKQISDNEIVIAWGATPKGSHMRPYRQDMYTVVTGPWTKEIAANLRRLTLSDGLTQTPTDRISTILKTLTGLPVSAHSIKRGAITHLLREVNRGVLTLEQVQRLGKHLSMETTLRYAAQEIPLAHALGTQHTTSRL